MRILTGRLHLNCQRMVAGADAMVIVDDSQKLSVTRLWRRCLRQGIIREHPNFPTMAATWRHRNEIGLLQPATPWRWRAHMAYAGLLDARRRLMIRIGRTRRRADVSEIDAHGSAL